ncbi:MAG: flippase-like domain-containing protein, partial [Prevotellaceae bacterium]|nr:flippase-like domain-containing protein [Prevotellaceae bacterium]
MGTTVPKKKWSKTVTGILKYVVFLALAAWLLYISFEGVEWAELVEGLRNANYWWVGASMLTGWMAIMARALRWRIIIEPLGYRPSVKNTYDAVMLTYLANFAMPRLGEVVRCGALRKTEKVPFESLLGTVVLERIFDILCLLIVTILVVALRMDTFGAFLHNEIWQPLMEQKTGAGGLSWLVIIAGVLVVMVVLLFIFRKKLLQFRLAQKINKLLKGLIDGLRTGFRLKRKNQFFAGTLVIWFFYFLQSYTIMHAMSDTASLSAVDALFLMVVGALGWVAPVPGGLGAYHFLLS